MSDEEQVRTMLASMGVTSIDEAAPATAAATRPPLNDPPLKPATEAGSETSPTAAAASAVSAIGSIAERRAGASAIGRDVPVSTVVHLMGLPTAAQISLLEGKIDVLTSKISSITAKIERLSSEVSLIKNDASIDRVDFQLNDIRGLLRRLVPKAAASGELETTSDPGKPSPDTKTPNSRAKILASSPPPATSPSASQPPGTQPPGTPPQVDAKPASRSEAGGDKDALEEFQQDHGEYQAHEGRRIRQEVK